MPPQHPPPPPSGDAPCKGILHVKFHGAKVWDPPFLDTLFVLCCLTTENPLKLSPNQRLR